MAGLNKVIVIGNLGQEPEMRFTPTGKPVTNFSIAVNEGEQTEWFNIVAWNKTAELANQYLDKGKQVCVEGRLQTRKWEDQEGKTHYKTEVVATKIVFLGKRTQEESSGDIEPDDLEL